MLMIIMIVIITTHNGSGVENNNDDVEDDDDRDSCDEEVAERLSFNGEYKWSRYGDDIKRKNGGVCGKKIDWNGLKGNVRDKYYVFLRAKFASFAISGSRWPSPLFLLSVLISFKHLYSFFFFHSFL